jgi:hypothetical protein
MVLMLCLFELRCTGARPFVDSWGVACIFTEIVVEKDKKRSRKMSFARPSTKLRSIERHQPSPPLSQRKGEGKRLVLIAAGPAESIFVKSILTLKYYIQGT